jgi:5-methylcytosine-specific restriction protein A
MAKGPSKVNRPWMKDKVAFSRPEDFSKFYNDRKWRKVSKAYREANPICECKECNDTEIVKPANVCDHIKGLKYLLDNNLNPYDWSELQSMSNECHNKKSGSESHRSKRGMG